MKRHLFRNPAIDDTEKIRAKKAKMDARADRYACKDYTVCYAVRQKYRHEQRIECRCALLRLCLLLCLLLPLRLCLLLCLLLRLRLCLFQRFLLLRLRFFLLLLALRPGLRITIFSELTDQEPVLLHGPLLFHAARHFFTLQHLGRSLSGSAAQPSDEAAVHTHAVRKLLHRKRFGQRQVKIKKDPMHRPGSQQSDRLRLACNIVIPEHHGVLFAA